jgi:DNA-binding response OmpR family regulator
VSSVNEENAAESVLVVEDERPVAELYDRWLTDAGYEVSVANSGDEALERASPAVDIVCLDRQLPGKNGSTVLSELRSRGIEARVVMITGIEPDFDIVEMPFDEYLVKPVSRSELLDTIGSLSDVSSYDSVIRQYFALSSKKAALQETKPDEELNESDEYESLVTKLEATRSQATAASEELEHEEYATLFHDFSSRSDDRHR